MARPLTVSSVGRVAWCDEVKGLFTVRPIAATSDDQLRLFDARAWAGFEMPPAGTLVRMHVAVEPFAADWKVGAWLRMLAICTANESSALTTARVKKMLVVAGVGADFMKRTLSIADLALVLQLAAKPNLAASQAHWVYADDWRWSRSEAAAAFARLLELPVPVTPRPQIEEEPLSEYASSCNEAAASAGRPKRLYLVGPIGDDHIFVAVAPGVFADLVNFGVLAPRY